MFRTAEEIVFHSLDYNDAIIRIVIPRNTKVEVLSKSYSLCKIKTPQGNTLIVDRKSIAEVKIEDIFRMFVSHLKENSRELTLS